MSVEENQMGLFEVPGLAPELGAPVPMPVPPPAAKTAPAARVKPAPAPPRKLSPPPAASPARTKSKAAAAAPPPLKKVSGLVPQGDVRLTANIRQDLHLKLKIASAYRRTTIGEILEELIATHL